METTNPRKAGALIINNLSMFNEAAILLEQQIEVKKMGGKGAPNGLMEKKIYGCHQESGIFSKKISYI